MYVETVYICTYVPTVLHDYVDYIKYVHVLYITYIYGQSMIGHEVCVDKPDLHCHALRIWHMHVSTSYGVAHFRLTSTLLHCCLHCCILQVTITEIQHSSVMESMIRIIHT